MKMMNTIDNSISALNHINPNCSREDWIKIGMSAKAAGLTFEHFHEWSRNADNYDGENDCDAVWKSFHDGKITAATLFKYAREQGWRPNDKYQLIQTSNNNELKNKSNNNNLAQKIWEQCQAVTRDHLYITTKNGMEDGLRIYPLSAEPFSIMKQNIAGYLGVPCYSNGELKTIQFISPDGKNKLNLPNASFEDGYYQVGVIEDRLYVCEGIGQAWAIYKTTGKAAINCFGAQRIETVALKLRSEHPQLKIIIIPDRGKEKIAAESAVKIRGYLIELPNNFPENYDVNDFMKDYGGSELEHLLNDIKLPPLHYKLLSGQDLLNIPPLRWIVQGILPATGLAAIYGPSMSGKSFLAIDLAYAIASGQENWFGYNVTKCPVIYLSLEGQAGLSKRVFARYLHTKVQIPDDLKFITQPFNLLTDDIENLATAILANHAEKGVVFIDTLNRATPEMDENSSTDMGKVINACQRLQALIGGIIILVHHTGKGEKKGPRGHSSLFAALDCGIETTKIENIREWINVKSKDDESGLIHYFNLEVIHLEPDEDDHQITSCAVSPIGNVSSREKRIPLPKSGNQKIILEALGNLFKTSKYFGKGDAPESKACLDLDHAINETMKFLPCNPKRQRERTKAAILCLVAKNILKHKDQWLWFT